MIKKMLIYYNIYMTWELYSIYISYITLTFKLALVLLIDFLRFTQIISETLVAKNLWELSLM